LNRDLTGRFGSEPYAREELRAELAQVLLCAELGIADCEFTNGAAYLSGWLKELKGDKKEIFRAAADAQPHHRLSAGVPPGLRTCTINARARHGLTR
jgi:antirestriction protein ArdC